MIWPNLNKNLPEYQKIRLHSEGLTIFLFIGKLYWIHVLCSGGFFRVSANHVGFKNSSKKTLKFVSHIRQNYLND